MLIFFISIAIFMWELEIHTHDPSRRDLLIHLVEISANIWRESVLFRKLGNKTKHDTCILKAEHFSKVSLLSPFNDPNATLHCIAMSTGTKERGTFATQVNRYIGLQCLLHLKYQQEIMPNTWRLNTSAYIYKTRYIGSLSIIQM